MQPYSIAIHGGAGTIRRSKMTPDREANYRKALKESLDAGYAMLAKDGSALDAVEAAVIALEDCPLFNAGRGSVFATDGSQEMEASIMEGAGRKAGAVTSLYDVRNPIALARLVMEKTPHVMLAGEGATAFARKMGIRIEPAEYFHDPYRYQQWQKARDAGRIQLDHSADSDEANEPDSPNRFGTVGAVACDAQGHVAAATSTGGMTNKQLGRIGDSALIGAGTYAWDATCAVSCTGDGEYFMRGVVAYDVSCLMEYRGLSMAEACRIVVQERLPALGGEGGLAAVDSKGSICLEFNSEGMYRGARSSDGLDLIAIYGAD